MIIHDNSDAAKYFVKGLDYVTSMPSKKSRFVKSKKITLNNDKEIKEYITIIGTTRKESIDFIGQVISQKQSSGYKIDQMLIVIVDYFKDSMIRSKYIKGKVLRGNKTKLSPIYEFVEFDELDRITQIEDEYNQCFSYKNLSRQYKKQLQIVKEYNEFIKSPQSSEQRIMAQEKGGNDFANSTLV